MGGGKRSLSTPTPFQGEGECPTQPDTKVPPRVLSREMAPQRMENPLPTLVVKRWSASLATGGPRRTLLAVRRPVLTSPSISLLRIRSSSSHRVQHTFRIYASYSRRDNRSRDQNHTPLQSVGCVRICHRRSRSSDTTTRHLQGTGREALLRSHGPKSGWVAPPQLKGTVGVCRELWHI